LRPSIRRPIFEVRKEHRAEIQIFIVAQKRIGMLPKEGRVAGEEVQGSRGRGPDAKEG